MSELLLPTVLLNEVTAEAITKMALTLPDDNYHHGCSIWLSPTGDSMVGKFRDGSSRAASREHTVLRFIQTASREMKCHPTDILRDLLGRPVSIPAQGWRVPRQYDYGRKDALVTHRVRPGELPPEAVTGWSRPWPRVVEPPAWSWQERMVHDIAELPT